MNPSRFGAIVLVSLGYLCRGIAIALLLSVIAGILHYFLYVGCRFEYLLLSLWGSIALAGVVTWQLVKRFSGWKLVGIFLILCMILQVLLTGLNASRAKPPDAHLKSIINNLRAQAEIYFDDTGSYAGLCDSTEVRNSQIWAEEIDLNAKRKRCLGVFWQLVLPEPPESIVRTEWSCQDEFSRYMIHASISSGEYYCIDNIGTAAITTVVGETQCNK